MRESALASGPYIRISKTMPTAATIMSTMAEYELLLERIQSSALFEINSYYNLLNTHPNKTLCKKNAKKNKKLSTVHRYKDREGAGGGRNTAIIFFL